MANPLVYAGSGAAAGVLVGGPVGAAIGAAAGLVLSMLGKEEPRQTVVPRQPPKQDVIPGTNEPEVDVPKPSGTEPIQPVTESELLYEADQKEVDPETIIVGKDGSYQGVDSSGAVTVLFDDARIDPTTGRSIGGWDRMADATIERERKRQVYYDMDCSDGNCVTSVIYEVCREYPGGTHESCAHLTSRHSYQYKRYGGGAMSEEDASFYPLDADLDKDTAFTNQKNSELNRAAGGADIQLCTYDWEVPLGGKCDGGLWTCESDFFCGEGNYCSRDKYGGGQCLPREPQMPVCRYPDRFGRGKVYPDNGMTPGEAMLEGLCPWSDEYQTAAQRAEREAQAGATQAGAVTAVEAGQPRPTEAAPEPTLTGLEALDFLASQTGLATIETPPVSPAVASRLGANADDLAGGLSNLADFLTTQGTEAPPVKTPTLEETLAAAAASKTRAKKKRGLGGVSPVASYMRGLGYYR